MFKNIRNVELNESEFEELSINFSKNQKKNHDLVNKEENDFIEKILNNEKVEEDNNKDNSDDIITSIISSLNKEIDLINNKKTDNSNNIILNTQNLNNVMNKN